MASDEQWENSCKIWASPDGSIYSNTFTAPAPSKNFLQIFVNSNQVILRIWKIIPPTRSDANQAPSQTTCTYAEFLDEEKIRGEIERNIGARELGFLDRIVSHKHLDWLNRLPRKVLLRIAFYLDLVSIARLGQVNKVFRELCSCDALWSKIYMDHTKKQVSQELLMLVDQKGWKEVFFMNKLQLQMQMRRTAKESRFHYGKKFNAGGSKDNKNFFLTSHSQHSPEDEESHSQTMMYQKQHSDTDSEMHAQRHYGKDDDKEQQLYQYDDSGRPQRQTYDDFEQTPDVDVYQYGDEQEEYGYQYQDADPRMHHTYQSDMSSTELLTYQE